MWASIWHMNVMAQLVCFKNFLWKTNFLIDIHVLNLNVIIYHLINITAFILIIINRGKYFFILALMLKIHGFISQTFTMTLHNMLIFLSIQFMLKPFFNSEISFKATFNWLKVYFLYT